MSEGPLRSVFQRLRNSCLRVYMTIDTLPTVSQGSRISKQDVMHPSVSPFPVGPRSMAVSIPLLSPGSRLMSFPYFARGKIGEGEGEEEEAEEEGGEEGEEEEVDFHRPTTEGPCYSNLAETDIYSARLDLAAVVVAISRGQ
jgi:hypothetical protein